VHLVIACRGEKGSSDPATDPDALAASRADEVARAAEVLQLASVEHLGYPDGEIENDAALRARLIEIVRRRQPDALVAPDPTAVFFGDSYVNHRDHRELGWSVLDSLVPAASPLYVPEAGPAHQVAVVLLSGTLEADAWVDIDAVLDTKVAAVACHESRLGGDPDLVAELLEHRAAEEGRRAGIDHAEAFRRLRFGS
jgi:LmbE family N-acetylglucosaminyl deacetylase